MGKLFEQIRSVVEEERFFVAWHADQRYECNEQEKLVTVYLVEQGT